MTNKLEQDKQIIADAPEGLINDLSVDITGRYFDKFGNLLTNEGVWANCDDTPRSPRSIEDIRENIALQERIAELEKENATLKHVEQIFNDSPDLTFETVQRLFEDELAKRDLQSKIEAVNHIISHDSAKCRSKRSLDCNAIHLADLYNYAIYLEQQLREQAKQLKGEE